MTPKHVVEKIRKRVSDWSQPDNAIRDELNAPVIPNPNPQPMVPRHLSARDLLRRLSPESLAKVADWGNLVMARDDIDGQDHDAAADMVQMAGAAGIITVEETKALLAYIRETVPDPNWRPAVSWAETTIGRPVTVNDVAAAREAE